MKRKMSKLCFGLVASAVLLGGNPASFAQEITYLNCANGGAVRDPYGDCILSPGGSPIDGCGPEMAKAMAEPIMISLAADANFDFDRSELKPAGQAQLSELYQKMQQVEVAGIDIVGHTDSKGSEAYNQALSERRAQSAANYLVALGTNPGLITTRGMGERQPIAPNTNPDGSDNPAGRAQNRRVDITVDAKQMQ